MFITSSIAYETCFHILWESIVLTLGINGGCNPHFNEIGGMFHFYPQKHNSFFFPLSCVFGGGCVCSTFTHTHTHTHILFFSFLLCVCVLVVVVVVGGFKISLSISAKSF